MKVLLNIHAEDEQRFYAFLKENPGVRIEKQYSDVGLASAGEPMTISAFNHAIDEAIADVEAGNFISLEDFKKKTKLW